MTIITKRSGETEEFDRKKIEDSIRNAGVNWEPAKEIAGRIQEKDGMRSSEIRKAIERELKVFNPGLSERYSNTRRFTVKNSVKNAKGIARLSSDSLKALRIKAGDTLEVRYRDRCQVLKIEEDETPSYHNEIILNENDMAAISVMEGNRLNARKH